MTAPTTATALPVVRAVRGATQVESDDPLLIEQATGELLAEIIHRNGLTEADFISILFTATHDLAAAYPAVAARKLGLTEVPLICATEIPVPGALNRTIRVMAHIHTRRPRSSVRHVYLGGAALLRPDLSPSTQGPSSPLPPGV